MNEIIPAATVVIFRHDPDGGPAQLLMVQRAKEMRFAGGATVFPGGKIDPADYELAQKIAPDADPHMAASRIAGIRETLEETGLAIALSRPVSAQEANNARTLLLQKGTLATVLERFGWQLQLEALVPFAHWCPNHTRAFDTRFFLTDLGTGAVDIAVDATENTRLFWSSARNSLAMAQQGDISIIFPTTRNLDRLAQFDNFAQTRLHAEQTPINLIEPHLEERDGETWLMIPDGLGYPILGEPISKVRRG